MTPGPIDCPIMHMDAYDYSEAKKVPTRQVLDFTLFSNPIGPSNKARHAMRKALKAVHLPPDRTARHLRRFIARKEQIDPGNILFGHGSTQLLDLLMTALKPGRLLAPSPLPPRCLGLAERHGAAIVPFPLREDRQFSLDAEALLGSLEGIGAIILPNPHPVTGTIIDLPTLDRVIGALAGSRTVLVIDEALSGFAEVETPTAGAVRSANVLILRTFSFFFGLAGLRLGYAIGSREACNLVAGVIDPGPVNTVAAAGALASLRDKGFPKRTAEFLASEKAYMTAKLARIEGIELIDRGCNFLLLAVRKSAAELSGRFLKRNVLVGIFEEEGGKTYIPVPLRRRRENARFARTLASVMAKDG